MRFLVVTVCLIGFCFSSELDTKAPWPTLRGDQGRTGVSNVVLQTSGVKQHWFHSLGRVRSQNAFKWALLIISYQGKGQWSTFVAVDSSETIYVCGDGVDPHTYQFFAYDTTGKQLWTYTYQAEYYNPGTCGNAIVGTENEIFWNVPGEGAYIDSLIIITNVM